MKNDPVVTFRTASEWERWLHANHATSKGVWLRFARKGSGERSLSREEALEVALCYGWIDGQAGPREDSAFWRMRFCPRRPRSGWSQVNCEKAEALLAAGRMQPAGLREMERAKADGRWQRAYAPPSRAAVPDDLARALADCPEAAAFFAALNSRNRYAILHRLETAVRPETRARRLETFVQMLREKRTLH